MQYTEFSTDLPVGASPVFISFFTDSEYYRNSARSLSQQLKLFTAGHYVCELNVNRDAHWAEICKEKIFFIKYAVSLLKRPVVWIDIDSSIIADPTPMLKISGADIGCIFRDYTYFPNFNFSINSRIFHPGYILYSDSLKSQEFIDTMCYIAKNTKENITDDYVLHEALYSFSSELSIHLYPSTYVVKCQDDIKKESIFLHGDSGNVNVFKPQVLQHKLSFSKWKSIAKVLIYTRKNIEKIDPIEAITLNTIALRIDPHNSKTFSSQLHLLEKQNDVKAFAELVEFGKGEIELRRRAYIADFEFSAKARDFKKAERIFDSAMKIDEPELKEELRSRRSVFWLDKRAREKWKTPSQWFRGVKRTRLWWWQKPYPGNWGDILNPYVVEKLSGVPPQYASKGKRLLAIGSIIGWADEKCTIWGSGSARTNQTFDISAKFVAVRGPLTRQLILNAGGKCPEVYGDPALLLPLLYTPKLPEKSDSPEPVLGLILHHSHSTERLKIGPGVRLINIRRVDADDIENFIDEVCECDAIVSSSLHGLIVAHAYGIPTRWADVDDGLSGKIPGDGMKFVDHFQSVGLHDIHEPLMLCPDVEITTAMVADCKESPAPAQLSLLRRGLLNCAPFPVQRRYLEICERACSDLKLQAFTRDHGRGHVHSG